MPKYLIKIITESNNVHNPNDKTNSGGFNQTLVLEKDGVEILRKPSFVALANFLNTEFGIPVVEIKQSYSEDWWTVPKESTCTTTDCPSCSPKKIYLESIVETKCKCNPAGLCFCGNLRKQAESSSKKCICTDREDYNCPVCHPSGCKCKVCV